MIDSKVTLHDIFYDISTNFLCSCPMLFTAGMCDITYIQVYNAYLHGKCFLSALYNDIICLTTQSTLLFVSSDSSSHVYATSRSSSLRKDRHTACRNTACSVFACAANTRHCSWTWSAPWNATSCQIFLLRMDNQFANENFTEIFVRHFAATRLVYKKCV